MDSVDRVLSSLLVRAAERRATSALTRVICALLSATLLQESSDAYLVRMLETPEFLALCRRSHDHTLLRLLLAHLLHAHHEHWEDYSNERLHESILLLGHSLVTETAPEAVATALDTAELLLFLVSLLLLAHKEQDGPVDECSAMLVDRITSAILQRVVCIPAVSPMLDEAAVLAYAVAIACLRVVQRCSEDPRCHAELSRAVLIRCQELVITATSRLTEEEKTAQLLPSARRVMLTFAARYMRSCSTPSNRWTEYVETAKGDLLQQLHASIPTEVPQFTQLYHRELSLLATASRLFDCMPPPTRK